MSEFRRSHEGTEFNSVPGETVPARSAGGMDTAPGAVAMAGRK